MTATPFATLAKLAERLSSLPIELWSKLRSGTFASYHPEHHYMRGPGPKWHGKAHRQRHITCSQPRCCHQCRSPFDLWREQARVAHQGLMLMQSVAFGRH